MLRCIVFASFLALVSTDAVLPCSEGIGEVKCPPEPPIGCDPKQEVCKLTAGDIDDNLNFITYLLFKDRIYTEDVESVGQSGTPLLPNPDLTNRVEVTVKDEEGTPFSCATVEVEGTTVTLSAGTDGKMALFADKLVDNLPARPWELIATSHRGFTGASTVVDGDKSVELVIPDKSTLPLSMDLALILDTTGSMCDEIDFLQDELGAVIAEIANKVTDLNFALILYKDVGDEYVTVNKGFQESTAALKDLAAVTCSGGGDFPEAVHSAWENAAKLPWRPGNVARVALMVGDAPPHRSAQNNEIVAAYNAALELRKMGVVMYGLAASDSDDVLEYLFRLASVLTHGRYMWLTEDSAIGNSKSDAKVACFQVTEMQNLLSRILVGVLDGKRYEAADTDIVREEGNQTAGICLIDLNDPEASLKADGNGGSGGGTAFTGGASGGSAGSFPFLCFPGKSLVDVSEKGPTAMQDVNIGDMVRTGDGDYSKVYSFGHYDKTAVAEYLNIQAEGLDVPLEISEKHMVFVAQGTRKNAVPAFSVAVGDLLILGSGDVAPVTKISVVKRTGAFAPFTVSGSIVVNGVVASSYVTLQDDMFMIGNVKTPVPMQWLAHAFQAPHRVVCHLAWSVCEKESYTNEGLSHWVSKPLRVSEWIVSQNAFFMAGIFILVFATALSFVAIETLLLYPWLAVATCLAISSFHRQVKALRK